MSNDYVLSKAIEKISDSLERGLKVNRSLEIHESSLEMARKVLLHLGMNPKIGSYRNQGGWRSVEMKVIWFTDRVQKEIFLEAFSILEEDPKPIEEENVFADRCPGARG